VLPTHELALKIAYHLRTNNSAPKSKEELRQAIFGADVNAARNAWSAFEETVAALNKLQLVAEDAGRLRLTKHFEDIRGLFRLSTQELARRSEASVVCDPVFGKPSSEKFDVFVIRPFEERFTKVLETAIRPACKRRALTVGFGKDLYSSKQIITEVWSLIFNAKAIVADCTSLNPNVFYEIGIAHTLGRYVILLTQNLRELPYDLQHLKTIEYAPDANGLKALEDTLVRWLETAGLGS
jgi:hypothetical protein